MGALFRKEMLAHLLSYRAPLALALVLCLTVGEALVFRADHRARLDAFNRAEALRMDALSRQCESRIPLAAALSLLDQRVAMRPSPLAFVAEGRERELPNVAVLNAFRVAEVRREQGGNPLVAAFDAPDWVLIATIALSFFAVVLTFDGMSGEREDGTLRLVLSNSVPRWRVVASKALAASAVLMAPVAVGGVLQVVIIAAGGTLELGAGEAARLGVALLLVYLFVLSFVLLGLACSLLCSSSGSALVIALLIWSVLVVIVPRSSVLLSSAFPGVDTADEVLQRKEQEQRLAADAFQERHAGEANRWVSGHWTSGESLELAFAVHRVANEVQSQWRSRQVRQVELARRLGMVSPAGWLAAGLERAAGTGLSHYAVFLARAEEYRASLEALLRARYPGNPCDAPGGDEGRRARIDAVKLSVSDIPAWRGAETTTSDWAPGAALCGGAFVLLDGALLLAVMFLATRYDVR